MITHLLRLIAMVIILRCALPVLAAETAPKKEARKSAESSDRRIAVPNINRDGRKRVALVIGNSSYTSSPLKNPANDARAMAATLRRLGFEVDERINLGYFEMNKAVEGFGKKLRSGGVGLFYYAGHGMQVNGANYLIPVDAQIEDENEVRFKAVDAGLVLAKMEQAKSDVNLVVLDACRDNPFSRSFRSASHGLASMDAPNGTFIAYATAPGKTAADGDGKNGLYTAELVKVLETPGIPVEQVFKRALKAVRERSGSKQTPWVASNLEGEFYFIPPSTMAYLKPQLAGAGLVPAEPIPSPTREDGETALWREVLKGNSKYDLEAYLAQYPKGRYVAQANILIDKLQDDVATEAFRKEQDAWRTADTSGSENGYQNYLKGWPSGRYTGLAQARLRKLQSDRRLRTAANEIFEQAKKGSSAKLEELSGLASQGNAYAQGNLARMYFYGWGVTKNEVEAVKLFRKAAEQGESDAQSRLGTMYRMGQGVAKDEVEAVKWYRKAAEQGNAYGQFSLGLMYANGLGIAKDDAEAVKWYRKAAEQGNANGQTNLGYAYEKGLGVAQSYEEAVKWYRKAAEQGNAPGQTNLGYAYEKGLGVAQSKEEAITWYRKAAAQGNETATKNLKIISSWW